MTVHGKETRILIDTDASIDGAAALLLALAMPDVRLVGLTTVHGVSGARLAAERVIRLCEAARPGAAIDAVAGADRPLAGAGAGPDAVVHGRHGLGDLLLPPASRSPLPLTVAEYWQRLADERPGELTLVLAGCPTNWANAVRERPELAASFGLVVACGGAALAPGDATPVAEGGFRRDPAAAAMLLETAERLTIAGLDVSNRLTIGMPELERLGACGREDCRRTVELLERLVRYRVSRPEYPSQPVGRMPLRGMAGVLAAARPRLFGYREWGAAVETAGELAAGMVVVDRRTRPGGEWGRPVRFAMEIDEEEARESILAAFAR